MQQQINEKTLMAMAEFFLKTSIPRILAEMKEGEDNDQTDLGKRKIQNTRKTI